MLGRGPRLARCASSVLPADVDPAESTPRASGRGARAKTPVGPGRRMIHNHPGGDRLLLTNFPGRKFRARRAIVVMQSLPGRRILCGESIVWINRAAIERHFSLMERPVVRALDQPPGNRLRRVPRVAAGRVRRHGRIAESPDHERCHVARIESAVFAQPRASRWSTRMWNKRRRRSAGLRRSWDKTRRCASCSRRYGTWRPRTRRSCSRAETGTGRS